MSTAPLLSRRSRTAAAGLCAAWFLTVVLIVLWPIPVDRTGGATVRRGLEFLNAHGLPPFITYGVIEFAANVLMFLPLGLFWFLLTPRPWRWLSPALAFVLAAAIETTQLFLLPHRFATPYDVLANTLGATLGALIAAAFVSYSASPAQER